jgi:hypothetical protein
MSRLKTYPISKEMLAPLVEAAKGDNHEVLFPTHVVKNGNEIVGYLSVCSTPIVNIWLDSKSVAAADSMRLMDLIDGHLRMSGVKEYIMPCAKSSPFFNNMERMGYGVLGENVWFHKNLNN